MERFRDLYAKMASSGGRTSSSKSPSDKPPLDASKLGLKFNYEPKHTRQTLNERIEDAIQIYKAEVDQPMDQHYVLTTQSGRQSYVYQNTHDNASLIQTGMDTTSARETAMIDNKHNLHYDYMSSSKEALSYVNTERFMRTPDQQPSAESIRSQQVINNYNAQAQKLKQPQYGGTNVKLSLGDGFAQIKAMVNESTASEHSKRQGEDVDEFREVSFNGLRNSPRHTPVQALMPVLMNHSANSMTLKNLNLSTSFSPRLPETDESKNLEDYNQKAGSPQRAYNLDLIDEQRSPVKSLHRSQPSSGSNDKAQFYETSKLSKSKNIVPYRSQTSQNGAARNSSTRSNQSKSLSKGSTTRLTTKHSAQSKKTERVSSRIRSNCEKVSSKKSRVESQPRGHSTGSEESPKKSISPRERIRMQDRASKRALSRSESRSAPAKTPSQERIKSSFEQPRITPLRNPRAQRDDTSSKRRQSPSDNISIHDQSSEEKAVLYGVNQDSFGFVQSSTQQKSYNDRSFSQKLSSIQEHTVMEVESDMKNKMKLNHDKMNLQRMLDDMTMSVNTIRSKYTPQDIADRSISQSRTRHHQSMQVDRQRHEIAQDAASQSPQRQGFQSCKTPRDIIQNCLSDTYDQPPTEHTFRPNETSGRMTTDSNFVRKYEERSIEAIRQSQMIIDRHKRKNLNESPPKPHERTPQPTSCTHVTEKEMRKVEQEADRLLDSRYMEASELREAFEVKDETRSNLSNSRGSRSRSRNYSRDARRIIEDQNRIVELLNMKNQGRNINRPPISPGRSFQTEPQPLDRPQITDRPNTTRVLDHQASYNSINRNLQMLNKPSGQRDVDYFIQEYRLSQKHQQMQSRSRSRPNSQDTIEDNYQPYKLTTNVKPDSRQNEVYENEPTTYREMSNAEPTTSRSTFTPGIETFCRKNRIQAVSEKDLTDIQQKTEQMCRQMTEARDLRYKTTENNPLFKDLRQQNDYFKVQNAQLQQEIEYYKQYAKEKQGEIFQLQKRSDELELDLADSNNSQLFTMYKQLKSDYVELEAQHKSKSFNLDQQSLAMNTLLQQYEKLKESQLSLLAMNKQMLVNHQKEVLELQQNLSKTKTELRAKNEKVETYQEIMKSFNGQITEFEEFQQHSQRDMNTLSEQYKLYKELYEKESMQKQLLIKKLQSGKLKVPKTQKQLNESAKKTKKRKGSKKRRASPHSSENSQDQTISYLSSPVSVDRQRERSSKNSTRKRKQDKKKERVTSPNSISPSSDPTFRRRQSPHKDRQSRSITPLRNFKQQASEKDYRHERSTSNNASAKRQKKRSRNEIHESTEDLGLRSNFARVKKSQTIKNKSELQTTQTQADEEYEANDRDDAQIRHFQMLEMQPDESTLVVERGFQTLPQSKGRNSNQQSFRGQSQEYPPGHEIQLNVVTPNSRITFMDQDQSYQQHEFNHIGLQKHEPLLMENADQKNLPSNRQRKSNRSHQSHSGSHTQAQGRVTNQNSNNNSDWQDRNQLDQVSMSSIPKNCQGSEKERSNMFYDPTYILVTNSSEQVDAEQFIDGVPYKPRQNNQQVFGGPKMIPTTEGNHRRRSSSLHRSNMNWNAQNMQAAELVKRVASRSPSNYKKRKDKKIVPMSSKDYYLRLKQMQQRLDRARQDIKENQIQHRSNSRSSGGTDNTRLQGDLSTIQEIGKGRVIANHTCARTKEQYRLVASTANKRSLQTTRMFKNTPGAIKRKQSRSLSANVSSSNSAIRTAIAGGSSKHLITQPTI